MATKQQQPDAPITKQERDELRRLTKSSFELTRKRLGQREQEVKNSISERLDREFQGALREAARRAKRIRDKVLKLQAEIDELTADMRTKGLEPIGWYGSDPKIEMPRLTYDVKDRQLREKRAFDRVAETKGFAEVDLAEKELETLTEIASGALVSDGALKILKGLPKADELLPSNGEIPKAVRAALEAPVEGEAEETN